MGSQRANAEQVLDLLDKTEGCDPGLEQQEGEWRSWRRSLSIVVTEPGGGERTIKVATRILSGGGLAILHEGFLHNGTRCELQLITSDNARVEIRAGVVRCRHLGGRVHESFLLFDEPVDDSRFMTKELNATVLLVDDVELSLRLTSHLLTKSGAEVVTAGSGSQALQLVAECDFDMVLLDVEMPEMSGTTVAKTMRERGITLPIIAYTANDDQATREECLAAGCSDVQIKPLDKPKLIEILRAFMPLKAPITSTLAGNPDMAEFIEEFVVGLPARIQEILECVQSRSGDRAGSLIRQLRVSASDSGGCGFGELSAAAEAMAKMMTEEVDWEQVDGAMIALSDLSRRVK